MSTPGGVHPGARWVKAALQVNPYAYLGRSAPSAVFADETSYNAALLDRCEQVGIEILAVTDHWSVDTARSLIDAATARGIVALPGFEANSAEGCHLLVIFETDTDFADINAGIGVCGATPGCANGTAGAPFRDILRTMAERGALVIPAHVNVANGGMLTGRSGPPLVNMVNDSDLHAIAVTPGVAPAPDQVAVCGGGKPYDRAHPLSTIHADDVSHPDTLQSEGAVTWFKVSSLRLESLKLAVRTPSTRVAVEDPTSVPRPLIREISWVGGFLDGVTIPISPDLTALIGGRGTGKSTVVESLRYALGVEAIGADAGRDHDGIVAGVLRSGTTVRLAVDTTSPTPGRYIIERSVPNPPVVRDTTGLVTNLKPSDVIGLVEIFGQHELSELAHDTESVARMLERFSGTTGPNPEHVMLVELAKENRGKLQRAEKARDDLEEELAEIPRLEEHVAKYTASDFPTRLAELRRLEQDAAIFTEGTDRLTEVRSVFGPLTDTETVETLIAPIDDIDGSPQHEVLQRVTGAMDVLGEQLRELSSAFRVAIDHAALEIETAKAAWKYATDPQRAGHAEVLRKLVEEGHDPDKYLTTTQTLTALRAKAQRRPRLALAVTTLLTERKELLGKLATNETKRSEELNDAIRAANAATKGVVVVRPIDALDRREIKAVVEKHVRGTRTQIVTAIDSPGFSPRTFVEAARGGLDALTSNFSIRGAQAAGLISAGEPLFRELEEMNVGQAVDVRLDITAGEGAREYRSLDELSKGQRATALLLLLLGASSAPLVIDQPEDDLDNRFVYDGIVQKLRELKGTRQFIVSTHNANVPVLGDAELIVALEGDGQRGWPVPDGIGSLDHAKIRELAENLLEGGRAAFDARKHLYGF